MCMDLDTDKGAISGQAEVVYEDPDSLQLQEYRPKNDGDIGLKECPAYEKPNEQPDIELVDCPAYVEKKKDQGIKLEECPAYGKVASWFLITVTKMSKSLDILVYYLINDAPT